MRRLVALGLAALAILGAGTSSARTTARAGGLWIVFGSDRDGVDHSYSVRPDGSRLTPLVPGNREVEPVAVSRDGSTVAYTDPLFRWTYVSRADGAGFRRLVPDADPHPALSANGKRLAFTVLGESRQGVSIIGTDGRGLRRLATLPSVGTLDWSPDGDALVLGGEGAGSGTVFFQPLRGPRRVLARGPDVGAARWSPDGRWIAYRGKGLYLVRPNGSGRHRIARGDLYSFAWSPDGKKIAFAQSSGVTVVGVDGRGLRRLRLRGLSEIGVLSWSPDGRRLALESGTFEPKGEIWVVGADGRGLRSVSRLGNNGLAGWTRLAPKLPPAPPLLPSETVLTADTVATRRPVENLSADGGRLAFSVDATAADCDHVVVWTPAKKALVRFRRPAPCGEGNSAGAIYDVELAGSRAAWAEVISCGNSCEAKLDTATLTKRAPVDLAGDATDANDDLFDFHPRGDGGLLVFDDGSRLVRIGAGSEPCQERGDYGTRICTTLRRGLHSGAVDSVSGGLIAVREADAVAVLDEQGKLLRVFPFGQGEVATARLDGGRLVVARSGVLEVYDVASGAGVLQRPVPSGYGLDDVDGGIAVLKGSGGVRLLRLADGRSSIVAPGRHHVLAELEPDGLYYSYTTAAGGGRVVFVPRSEVARQLGGSAR
jgi:Tol biopolymer transport system component